MAETKTVVLQATAMLFWSPGRTLACSDHLSLGPTDGDSSEVSVTVLSGSTIAAVLTHGSSSSSALNLARPPQYLSSDPVRNWTVLRKSSVCRQKFQSE